MNKQSIETARDSDLRLSLQAMRRAAQRARELAAHTGTAIVVSHHGVIAQISPSATGSLQYVQEQPTPYGNKP